jgi:hypothetical protein
MRIGIDFDNTIITYDAVFLAAARERGLIGDDFTAGKQVVRDFIRTLPDGERAWQRLQGYVYGQGIAGAAMFEGVETFLRRCRQEGCLPLIVSHKTEFGHFDPARVSLRQAALDWMTSQGFFRDSEFGIPVANIYFEGTRVEKLARIAALGCTHFVDDLEEILIDPAFPSEVTRILFAPAGSGRTDGPYLTCGSWREIERRIFHDRT